MSISFTLILGLTLTPAYKGEDYADLLELNHKYVNGTRVYSQIIAWRRRPENGKYEVRTWKMVDHRDGTIEYPYCQNGVWHADFRVNDRKVVVRAGLFRETFTAHDPESMDRARLPEPHRIRLADPKLLPLPTNQSQSRNDEQHDSP